MKVERVSIVLAAAAALIVTSTLQATTVTWTGGGSGTNWNEAANWDAGIPGATDTAVLGAAITGTKVIMLGASQTVSNLVIATTATLTVGNAGDVASGYALTLTNVDRQDVAGTENLHAFAARVNIAPDGNTNSTWTVNGSSVLRMNAVLGSTATVTFVKLGTGTFNLNYKSPAYAGPWSIVEGAVTASGTGTTPDSMKGNATIGGTAIAASLTQSNKNALYSNMNVTLLTNGTFTAGDIDNGRVNSIHAKEGGVATIGPYFYCLHAYLTGGRINGGSFFNGGFTQDLRSYASGRPAVFNCHQGYSSYYEAYLSAENGAAAIDLDMTTGSVGGSAKVMNREGAGTIILGKSSSHYNSNGTNSTGFLLKAGVTIFNNPATGSGCGKNPMQVNGGATAGGTGLLGGDSAYANFNVLAQGASSSSLAAVAPGSVDTNTAASLIGTLTVGSATMPNKVTFGNHSRLRAQVGADGAADRLTVNGTLDLSSTSDGIVLAVDPAAKHGTYVLASATGGITGTFDDNVTGLPSGHTITYTATTVELTVPPPPTLVIVR